MKDQQKLSAHDLVAAVAALTVAAKTAVDACAAGQLSQGTLSMAAISQSERPLYDSVEGH